MSGGACLREFRRVPLRVSAWLPCLLLLGAALSGADAAAQSVHIQISEGPYFEGEAIEVHLVVEGFDEDPAPDVDVNPNGDGQLKFVRVSPSVQSSISIINGRMTRTKLVRFIYQYRFTAPRSGKFRIGPFRVKQGNLERTAGPVQVDFQPMGKSDRVRIDVKWPDEPVYPGQRVEVEIEWAFEMSIADRLHSYRIEVPIFNHTESFRFIDTHPQQGETSLEVQTQSGQISLKADVAEQVVIKGRLFKVVKAKRILIPLKHGEYHFQGPTVVVDEVVRWRRNLFGQRTAQGVRKVPAKGERRKLVVLDVPKKDRPASYAGAIGRGFSLEVSADRSVLQVGDPIELTIVLRGDGNLEGAGLPSLSAEGSLSPELFRSPTNRLGGAVKDGAKTFVVPVRVLDASIREIPPIPYSYFNTDSRKFVTVYSRPIALSVKRGKLVTAADVVSNAEPVGGTDREAEREGSEQGDDSVRAGDSRSATGQLVLTGANLSIVREPARLLHNTGSLGESLFWNMSLYGASLVAVVIAILLRRRADLDPAWVKRRRRFAAERSRIEGAATKPRAEAMADFSSALRAMLKESSAARSGGLDAFLAECDAVSYAPPGSGVGAVGEGDLARARTLAQQLEDEDS